MTSPYIPQFVLTAGISFLYLFGIWSQNGCLNKSIKFILLTLGIWAVYIFCKI